MAGEKLVQKALQAAMEARAAKHVADPAERAANLAKFLSRSHAKNTETGDPIRLYHITPETNIDALKAGGNDPSISGMATWLSPYADEQPAYHNVGSWKNKFKEGTNVMPVYANLERPLLIDTPEMISWAQSVYGREFPLLVSPKTRQMLIDDGYDSVIYGGGKNPEEYAAKGLQIGQQANRDEQVLSLFPETQLKSATGNIGTFNPSIPRLTENHGGEVREHHADGERVSYDVRSVDPRFGEYSLTPREEGSLPRAVQLARSIIDAQPSVPVHGAPVDMSLSPQFAGMAHAMGKTPIGAVGVPVAGGNLHLQGGYDPLTKFEHYGARYTRPFADGGEVRAGFDEGGFLSKIFSGEDYQSNSEPLIKDGQINWGDPNNPADYFRAASAMQRATELAKKVQEEKPRAPRSPEPEPAPPVPQPPQREPASPAPAAEAIETVAPAPVLSTAERRTWDSNRPGVRGTTTPAEVAEIMGRRAPTVSAPAAPAPQAMPYAPVPSTEEVAKLTNRVAPGPDLTDRQRDLIVRTIAAETSGKSPEETRAIAHVILNRIQSGKFGATPEQVLFAKNQFEPWTNPAGLNYPMRISPQSQRYVSSAQALDAALGGEDITGGASHFWGPASQFALGRQAPSWGRTGGVDIGATRFHKVTDVAPAPAAPSMPQQPAQPSVGLFAFGTNDANEKNPAAGVDTALKSAQRIYDEARRAGMQPVFVLPNANDPKFAPVSDALRKFAEERGIQYEAPSYDPKDALHITPKTAQDLAKKYPGAFVAGDSNSWRLQRYGYGRPVADQKSFIDPRSGVTLGRVGAGSSEIAKAFKEYVDSLSKGRAAGGEVLSDKYPTHYLTNVGRQVAQAGGLMSDAIYDPMGNVLVPAATDPVEAARGVVRDMPRQTEGERALQLARDIKNYEASMARINAQPEYYRQMTHAPSKPMAPIQIEGGLIGKENIGEAAYDVAGPMSSLAQTAYDLKTAPFYFTPAAPVAFATDIAEGVANKSPLQVGLAAFGAPGKATRAMIGPAVGASVLAPEEAKAARLPKTVGIKRSTNLPNIREMSIADAIRIARREPHLIPSGEASEGFYIGGPRSIENKRQLNALRKQFDEYVGADPRGGDWYDRYRASVNEVTGGNPVQNKWMTSQHGQFSAGVSPESELAFAIKENNASIAGMPVKAARPAQHEAHNRAIANLDPEMMQLGDKTGEYARLISPDQARPPGATGVNDFRHARNFRYTEASGEAQRNAMTAAQHKFMDYETALAVDRANKVNLGNRSNWTGEQLQAAPWVRQKALDILAERPNLVNQHMPVQLALAKAAGLEGKAAEAVARREAERLGYESAFKEANKTIGDFFGKHTAFATHEAQPGSLTGHLPGSQTASQAEREAFAADPRSSWAFAPGGRDALYSGLEVPGTGVAMRVRPTRDMQGVYTTPAGVTETNPGQVARPLIAFNSGEVKTVSPADEMILNAGEKVRAYLDAQNAGAWHKPWVGGKAGLSNSYFLPLDRPATLDEIMKLRGSLETQGPATAAGEGPRSLLGDVTDTGSGLTVTRFGETVPQWDRAQRKEIERLISENMPVGARDMQRVSVDSGYAGLEGHWPQGGGATTREMLKDVNATPQLREAFNNNAYIPQKALMNLERDAQWSAKWGATKQEIDNARRIIGEGPGWIDRLEDALKKGVVLPAIGAALLSPAMLMQSEQTEQ